MGSKPKESKPSYAGLYVNIGLLAVSVFLLVSASAYPKMARTFPQLVLILVLVITGMDILKTLFFKDQGKNRDPQDVTPDYPEGKKVSFTVVLMFLFLFFMLFFGFAAGTFIFLLFACWSLGYRKKWGLLISCILITGFMYLLFILIMKSFLPEGIILEMLRS